MSQNFYYNEVSKSATKRYGFGSSDLRHWSVKIFARNVVASPDDPRIWTRHTSKSVVVGVISTEPLIEKGTYSIRCLASTEINMRLDVSCAA